MARAIIKFDEREMTIGEDATSFGRTTDNTVSFPDNTNMSRNHAEIEYKDGKYVVTDLGSSNGTTINGQQIEGETPLNNGDFITIGNSVIVEFIVEDDTPENAEEAIESDSVNETQPADTGGKSSRLPVILGVTGAVCGLAVVLGVAAVYVSVSGGKASKCEATARIVSPINGEIISEETEIKVEVKNSACVSIVRVKLNGKEIAKMNTEPYAAQIDPQDYPELANGMLNDFQVVLEDIEGNSIPQPLLTSVQFETKKVVKPTPTATTTEVSPTLPISKGKEVKLSDIKTMTEKVVTKFTGVKLTYNLSNPEFLKEVQRKTADYSTAQGYFQRANGFKDVINQSFVRDRNLDASLPYILAMSRSKFNLEKQGANEGLWQMSSDFATANLYFVICQTPILSDPTQDCASKVAALYIDIIVKTFDFDIIYAVAAFGKTEQEANIWKTSLPADRSEFWKVITDANQREIVVRFFAAAIVAENPQRFGLKNDRPISELYPSVGK